METITLTQLAKKIGIHKTTLYDMIKDGRFPVEPIKGTHPRRWLVSDIEAWLRNER
jgi:excisionase family DNA binding protein